MEHSSPCLSSCQSSSLDSSARRPPMTALPDSWHSLGCGSYGDVYSVGDGAVKVSTFHADLDTGDEVRHVVREIYNSAALSSPYVISYKSAAISRVTGGGYRAELRMPLYECALFQSFHGRTAAAFVTVMEDVAAGLDALHRAGIIHGDLKPGNILLNNEGRATICDLGMSVRVSERLHRGLVQTPQFRAPEVDADKLHCDYDTSIDIWSAGCIIYEFVTRHKRFAPSGGWAREYYKWMSPSGRASNRALGLAISATVGKIARRIELDAAGAKRAHWDAQGAQTAAHITSLCGAAARCLYFCPTKRISAWWLGEFLRTGKCRYTAEIATLRRDVSAADKLAARVSAALVAGGVTRGLEAGEYAAICVYTDVVFEENFAVETAAEVFEAAITGLRAIIPAERLPIDLDFS